MGAISVNSLFACSFYLPRSTDRAKFLNEEEKALAFKRIQTDSSAIVNETLVIRDAIKVFKMPQAWVWLGIEICLGVPLQSVSLFLPQIVGRLGYEYEGFSHRYISIVFLTRRLLARSRRIC